MTTVTIQDFYIVLSKQHARKTMYIEFIKRGDGSLRRMAFQLPDNQRNGGNRQPIHRVLEDVKNEILTVWDLNEQDYRRIDLRSVQKLVIDQEEFTITP